MPRLVDENEVLIPSSSQQTTCYHSIEYRRSRPVSITSQETIDNKKRIDQDTLFSHQYWSALFNQYTTSIYLENKGSVARDHLANERTYLAWLRTSLSTISVGIGLTQLFRLEKSITPPPSHYQAINGQVIGIFFIIISILFLFFAFIRYFHAQVAMMNGYFPASRSSVLIATSTLLITMTFILIFVSRQ